MTQAVSSSNSLPVVPNPAPLQFEVVSSFADKICPFPPPTGILNKGIFWIQSCYHQLVQIAYRFFFPDQIKKLREEIVTVDPAKVAALTRSYSKVLPEIALLTVWYGEKNKETDDLKSYWLSRGYLLFSDLSSARIVSKAEISFILEQFADFIYLETEVLKLNQEQRVLKAIDFLDIAFSSINRENLPLVGTIISETLSALFPDGVDPEEKLWEVLDLLIDSAKERCGEDAGNYFEDHLLVFVKFALRNSEEDQKQAMHAIRHHIKQANQPQSTKFLSYLAEDKWSSLERVEELTIIRKAISSSNSFVPEKLLGLIFKHFVDTTKAQEKADLYLFPSPWRDHLAAGLLSFYLGPLALPSGQKNLFTAVYLSDTEQTRYVSHLLLTEDKAIITPALITPKDPNPFVPSRIFRLFEVTMEHLRKHKHYKIESLLETISWANIEHWVEHTPKDAVSLRTIAGLYRAKFLSLREMALPSSRRVKLKTETDEVRLHLIRWMKDCWKQACPKDEKGFPFEDYTEETLANHVPVLLKVMEAEELRVSQIT